MSITSHNIPGVPAPQLYSHAAVAKGKNIVYVSGQVGVDATGNVVSGGLAAQVEQAIINVGLALEAAGAKAGDLVKTTFYVVDWDPSMMDAFVKGGIAARKKYPFPDVALTLIGVKSLFTPEMLVEVEAVAVTE